MSIKWLLRNDLNNFFSEVELYDSNLWNRLMPKLKHSIQDKVTLSYNKKFIKNIEANMFYNFFKYWLHPLKIASIRIYLRYKWW